MNVIDTAALPARDAAVGAGAGHDGFIGVRPENVLVQPAGEGRLSGRVELVESLGADTLIYANVAGSTQPGVQIVARQSTRTTLRAGRRRSGWTSRRRRSTSSTARATTVARRLARMPERGVTHRSDHHGNRTGRQGGRRHRRGVGHRTGQHRGDAGSRRARGAGRPRRGSAGRTPRPASATRRCRWCSTCSTRRPARR